LIYQKISRLGEQLDHLAIKNSLPPDNYLSEFAAVLRRFVEHEIPVNPENKFALSFADNMGQLANDYDTLSAQAPELGEFCEDLNFAAVGLRMLAKQMREER